MSAKNCLELVGSLGQAVVVFFLTAININSDFPKRPYLVSALALSLFLYLVSTFFD